MVCQSLWPLCLYDEFDIYIELVVGYHLVLMCLLRFRWKDKETAGRGGGAKAATPWKEEGEEGMQFSCCTGFWMWFFLRACIFSLPLRSFINFLEFHKGHFSLEIWRRWIHNLQFLVCYSLLFTCSWLPFFLWIHNLQSLACYSLLYL